MKTLMNSLYRDTSFEKEHTAHKAADLLGHVVINFLLPSFCLFLLAFLVAELGSAQVLRQADVEIIAGPLGFPCEPGDRTFGFFPCPSIEKQGVFIHVRSDDWKVGTHDGYLVTVTYRTATGETKTVTCGGDNPCPKRKRDFGQDWDDGWRAIAFQIGRVATGPLSGITVESIAVTKIPAPSAVITIGKTEFGVPK